MPSTIKIASFVLFLGLIVGGCTRAPADSSKLASHAPSTATDRTALNHEAVIATPTFANYDRISEWKLSAEDIRTEFAHTGQVIRSRAAAASEHTAPTDSTLIAQINNKLRADPMTATLIIGVESNHGTIMLHGSADSLDQIGQAVALSLDTHGVKRAISQIKRNETM